MGFQTRERGHANIHVFTNKNTPLGLSTKYCLHGYMLMSLCTTYMYILVLWMFQSDELRPSQTPGEMYIIVSSS